MNVYGLPIVTPGLKPSDPLVIRSTGLANFQQCPRMGLLSGILGLTRGTYSSALQIGTLYGIAKQALLSGQCTPQTIHDFMTPIISAEQKRLENEADDHGILPDNTDVDSRLHTLHKDSTLAIILALFSWTKNASYFKARQWEVIGSEIPVHLPVTFKHNGEKTPVRMATRLDLLLLNRTKKEAWVAELKTTSEKPFNYIHRCSFSVQAALTSITARNYIRQRHSGVTLRGVIYDVIEKPRIRIKKEETKDAYLKRVAKWYEEELPPLETPRYAFSQVPYGRKMSEAVDEMLATASAFTRRAVESRRAGGEAHKAFPRNSMTCSNVWGKTCQFLPLCAQHNLNSQVLTDRSKIEHKMYRQEDPSGLDRNNEPND